MGSKMKTLWLILVLVGSLKTGFAQGNLNLTPDPVKETPLRRFKFDLFSPVYGVSSFLWSYKYGYEARISLEYEWQGFGEAEQFAQSLDLELVNSQILTQDPIYASANNTEISLTYGYRWIFWNPFENRQPYLGAFIGPRISFTYFRAVEKPFLAGGILDRYVNAFKLVPRLKGGFSLPISKRWSVGMESEVLWRYYSFEPHRRFYFFPELNFGVTL